MPLGDLYNREEWGPGSNIADNIANRYAQDEKERLTPPSSIRKPETSAIPLGGEASAENPFIMAKDQEKRAPSLIVREAPEKIAPPAEQKNPANPEAIGVEAPNPLESPAGAIAATQHNLQNGVGRQGIITPPQQPDYAAILKQMETVESKRVAFDANKAPDWQNSQALTFSLLSFGMNLMAGNDAATAFNQAGATFNELYGREKRQAWANDLRSQGYDEHEIQAYVETGDHKALTDPAEKQARAVERRKAQLGLLRAEYEASPEYVQYQQQVEAQKAAREAGRYEMDVANHEGTTQDRAERLRMAQEKHVQDMADAKAKSAAEGKPDAKAFMGGLMAMGIDYDQVEKAAEYELSAGDALKGKAIDWLPEDMRVKAKDQYLKEYAHSQQTLNQVSELLGRSLSGAALSETKERPTWYRALMPSKVDSKEARERKRIVFESMKLYAMQAASGQKEGRLSLSDVDNLARGNGEFLVDASAGGRVVGIRWKDGSVKQL